MSRTASLTAASCAVVLAAAGCGSSSSSTGHEAGGGSPAGSTPASSQATTGAGALSAEARSAATGDIPDNQVFLVFRDPAAGYSMKYPEGWTRSGGGDDVTFRSKNNIVHVLIAAGAAPTTASMAGELQRLASSIPSLTFTAPRAVRVGAAFAIKATYTTRSAPDPVTGRSVLLIVDRYAMSHGGRVATIDLGTQRGVDNIDAYRMMVESFTWR